MPDTRIDVSVNTSGLKARLDRVAKANRDERLRYEREGATRQDIEKELVRIDAGGTGGGRRFGSQASDPSSVDALQGRAVSSTGQRTSGGATASGQAFDRFGRKRSGGPDLWKRLDPSAQKRGYALGMAYVKPIVSSTQVTWRVYSGNGVAYAEWTEPVQPAYVDSTPEPPADIQGTNYEGETVEGLHQEEEFLGGPYLIADASGPGCTNGDTVLTPYHNWKITTGAEQRTLNQKEFDNIMFGRDHEAWVALPAGGDRIILAKRRYANIEIKTFWAIRTHESTLSLYTYTQSNPAQSSGGFPCGGTIYLARYDGVFSNSTDTGTFGQTFTTTIEKCVLVSHETAREVPVPEGLATKLRELVPESSGTTSDSVDLVLNTVEAFKDSPSGPLTETISQVFTGPSFPVTKHPSLLARFGLSGGGVFNYLDPWTAGVYVALDYAAPSIAPSTPAEDAATFAGSVPLPLRWLFSCEGAATCDVASGTMGFSSSAVLPSNYYTLNPGEPAALALRQESKVFRGPVANAEQHQETPGSFFIVAWDWGKPGYCRSQLVALGFTDADLIP